MWSAPQIRKVRWRLGLTQEELSTQCQMAQESASQTLQATIILLEAWLRMVSDGHECFQQSNYVFGRHYFRDWMDAWII